VRIWDVSPGYLNRQSLLGEHRELHGVLAILVQKKVGYSRHPETLRWTRCLSGVAHRHALLTAEMRLRGYTDRTPVVYPRGALRWPLTFVTPPAAQFSLLASKYRGKPPGRIRLPRTVQELWAQHKYSVMARDPLLYLTIGRRVARLRTPAAIESLAEELVQVLRQRPDRGRLQNALEHMWGHVADAVSSEDAREAHRSPSGLLLKTSELAWRQREPYLLASTALAELAVFVDGN
jgi:hypothetical protein